MNLGLIIGEITFFFRNISQLICRFLFSELTLTLHPLFYLLPIVIITIMITSNLEVHYSHKVCCMAIVFRCVKCFRQWNARVRGTVYSLTSIMVAVMGVRVCLTR